MEKIRSGQTEQTAEPVSRRRLSAGKLRTLCASLAAVVVVAVGLRASLPYLNGMKKDAAANEQKFMYALTADRAEGASDDGTSEEHYENKPLYAAAPTETAVAPDLGDTADALAETVSAETVSIGNIAVPENSDMIFKADLPTKTADEPSETYATDASYVPQTPVEAPASTEPPVPTEVYEDACECEEEIAEDAAFPDDVKTKLFAVEPLIPTEDTAPVVLSIDGIDRDSLADFLLSTPAAAYLVGAYQDGAAMLSAEGLPLLTDYLDENAVGYTISDDASGDGTTVRVTVSTAS